MLHNKKKKSNLLGQEKNKVVIWALMSSDEWGYVNMNWDMLR